MFQFVIEKLGEILSRIHPIFLFSSVVVLGMYVFWRGSSETRKDKSSVFDIFFVSTFIGLIIGRISYIISNWERFSSTIWYWLPYEKYGDEIFLFRVLPWKFFRVWDWGIDILLMFVGFLAVASIAVIFMKKWRWSHMFTTLFFTVQTMLAVSFFLLGSLIGDGDWIVQGLVMLALPIVLFALRSSVKKIMIGKRESGVLLTIDIFFVLITMIYISYTYLTTDITVMEKGGVIFLVIWTLWGIVMNISDSRKVNVTIEKVSSVRPFSSIDINQPIKLPK